MDAPVHADTLPESLPDAQRRARLAPFPEAPRWARGCALAVILLTLIYLATKSGDQLQQRIPADFEYFYKAGASLYHVGVMDDGRDVLPDGGVVTRGMLDWYWPIVARLMSPLTLLPFRTAGAVWAILNLVLLLATLRMLGREVSGFPPRDWAVTQVLPLLLLIVYWVWEFTLNQIDTLTLFLLVLSFVSWQRGRAGVAGFWLGLAALLKITPGLVLVWFLLKRQFRTVGVALLTVILAGPISDLLIFGPEYAGEIYSGWLQRAVSTGSQRGLVMQQREMDWRNQGWGAVASRWLHRTNWNTHFDNEPRVQNRWAARYLNVVDLPRGVVAGIVMALLGVSLLGLLWLARKPAAQLSAWQVRMEWALFLLAMLWFMPVMRRYHMIWALPTLTLLGPALHWLGTRQAWSRWALFALLALLLAQVSLVFQDPKSLGHIGEALGVHLAVVGLLGCVSIALLRKLARDPGLMPEEATDERRGARGDLRPRGGAGRYEGPACAGRYPGVVSRA